MQHYSSYTYSHNRILRFNPTQTNLAACKILKENQIKNFLKKKIKGPDVIIITTSIHEWLYDSCKMLYKSRYERLATLKGTSEQKL